MKDRIIDWEYIKIKNETFVVYIKNFKEKEMYSKIQEYNKKQEHIKLEIFIDTEFKYYYFLEEYGEYIITIKISTLKNNNNTKDNIEVFNKNIFIEFMEIMDFINDEVTVIEDKNNDNISDVINSPKHYQLKIKGNNIEVIDIIDSIVQNYTPKQAIRVANIIKYILRADKKNGLEDFKKAKKYIEMLLEMEG